MQVVLDKIDDLLKSLNSLPSISEDNLRKLEDKFCLEFNYNSNHIEGNTLTYGETKLLLIFGKTEGVHELREFEEMNAHNTAYRFVGERAKDTEVPLTETFIKQLNEIILVRPFWKDAITYDNQATKRLIKIGEYKEFSNSVKLQTGDMFEYASPLETPIKMGELLQWYNIEIEKNEINPIALAALLHHKFVLIHPFDDGNGRVARLLMNYVLLKHNFPPVIIKSSDKKNYLNALNQADTGNVDAFVKYIAEQLVWSLEMKLKATKGESIEEENDYVKEINLFKKAQLSKVFNENIKTDEIVRQCFNSNIDPLLKELDSNLLQFKDLFIYMSDLIVLCNFGKNQNKVVLLTSLKTDVEQTSDVTHINWTRIFEKSINGNIGDTRLDMKILFEPTFYIFIVNNQELLKRKYNQTLTQSEISETIGKCLKLCFEVIKSNTKA